MQLIAISDFEKDIKAHLANVNIGSDTLVIDIGKGSGVIIVSLDEYNQLIAARHELSIIKKKKKN